MQPAGKRTYGKVGVKRINHRLDDIPDDCGYMKRFRFNIDMNSDGIMGDCIEWCQQNCEGKWGWWFEQTDLYDPMKHNWEEQNAYMSFQYKRDATRFWMSKGIQNMGNRKR